MTQLSLLPDSNIQTSIVPFTFEKQHITFTFTLTYQNLQNFLIFQVLQISVNEHAKQVAISQINNRGSLLLSGYQTFTRCPCLCPDLRWKTSDHNIHSKKTWPPFLHQNWVISLLREERGGIAGVRVGHFSWGQMEMVTWISYISSKYYFSFPRR